MALFKKKTAKKKVAKKKNQVKEFVDGKEVAPEKIPDLEIPVPTPDEDSSQTTVQEEKQQTPEEVFAEGRSVGFQEGLIYAINLTQDHLQQHQEELKKKIAEKEVQP